MKRLILFSFLIINTVAVLSIDIQSISFKKFPIKETLPNSIVKRIFQDKRGYIWLGTEAGICRYDGYKLITIKSNIEHPNLLTSGNILCIAEDKKNRIWFGTDRGINIVDENNQIVKLFSNHKIQNLRINSILCDKNGDMWIGSENGLFVYNYRTNSIKRYYQSKKNQSVPGNNVNQVFEDKAGRIWVAFWRDGLCRFNEKHETFERLPRLGKNNNPFTIFEDSEHNLWVGTWTDGLFKIKFSQEKSVPVYTQFIQTINPNSLTENVIYSITQDNINGNIWVLSQMGLSIITDKENIRAERINALDLFNDASNSLNQIMKDRQGNIWIATSNDGIYFANLNKPLFQSNTLEELKKHFGFITVNSIFEDNDNLILGLAKFGVAVMDKKTELINENSELNKLLKENFQSQVNTVNCFCENRSDGSVWIGGDGILARYYKQNNKLIFENISRYLESLSIYNRRVTSLYCDSKNRMWLGTRNGVFLFTNNSIKEIITDLNNVISFSEEKNGTIWIASPSNGIVRISEKRPNAFISKQYKLSKNNINSDEINAIVIDSIGTIWAGTNNGGLNRYEKSADKFISQNKDFSILDEDVKNIIVGDSNYLWLSTNNKILKIDLQKKSPILFSSNDNIKISSFRAGTYFKGNDGKFYFGGGNGFCSFYPNIKKQKLNVNKVVLTDIEIANQSIFNNLKPKVFDTNNKTLYLNYNQRSIGFEFSALNYTSPSNINYAYKLSDVDNEWVKVDSKRRYVNYNSLKKGKYTFKVKSTDGNGVWSDDITTLNFEVAPAPSETWWAHCLYVIILFSIMYVIYKAVKNRIRLMQDLLISKIDKEKTEELTQTKLRYFTNISHELLTPLTIISCLIDDFNSNFPSQFKQYAIMKSNILRLKRLLQQILDFRKVESGNMKLSVKNIDLVAFVNNICWNNFDPLAKEKNITFSITAPEVLLAWTDTDKIDKILFNIISNAFKHTPSNGSINITIQTTVKQDVQFAQLFISDTGSGISQARMPYIFDRFYGNEFGIESNGIGLSLTKELVELHKGNISVESQLNIGTTFAVEIPIDSRVYAAYEHESGMNEISSTRPIEQNDIKTFSDKSVAKNNDIIILVVEDNIDLLMILVNSLSRFYKVISAQNGVQAVQLIKDNDIDLVVSDVMMPEMDGITLCRTIKENIDFSHLPVLLLTAKNQITDRIECYNAGADAYISKPFEMEVLEARINSLIFNRQKKNKEYKSSLEIHPPNYKNDSLDEIFLRQAIEFVEVNLGNFDFTHDQLIDVMNSSRSTLYRKLKSLTGLSPSEFVRNIRLKHACLMLKNKAGNISEIAYAVGFSDPRHFSTSFKTEFGISPREYSKLNNDESK